MLQVHHEFTLHQLGKVDLRAVGDLPRAPQRQPAGARIAVAAEKLSIGEHHHPPGGKGEPAPDDADAKLDGLRLHGRNEVVQPLHFTLVIAKEEDALPGLAPLAQLREKALALPFIHHEIARLELAEAVLEKGGAEILDPAVCRSLQQAHARAVPGVSEGDGQVLPVQIIRDEAAGLFRRAGRIFEKQGAAFQGQHGGLRIEVELADGFDLVAEEFQPHRLHVLEGVDIQDAAADGVLPALRNLAHVLVSGGLQLCEEAFAIQLPAAEDGQLQRLQRGPGGRRLAQAGLGGDHDPALFPAQLLQHGEPLGRAFGVAQRSLDHGALGLGQEERVRHPVQQLIVQGLLGAHVRTDDPRPMLRRAHDGGAEEGTGRRHDLRKDGAPAGRDLAQLRRDRLRLRDAVHRIELFG